MQETGVPSLGGKDFLVEEMTTHSSILDWEMPQTEEPGGLWDCKESDTTGRLNNNSNNNNNNKCSNPFETITLK